MNVLIKKIIDSEQCSAACSDIIKTITAWFGQDEANEAYVRDIHKMDVFGAFYEGKPIGLIALKYHFENTAEIWWMGIRAEFHRQGIGHQLFEKAKNYAKMRGCSKMVVMTLNPSSNDVGYAGTRAFYCAVGFSPLVKFNEDDLLNPMMWMIQEI